MKQNSSLEVNTTWYDYKVPSLKGLTKLKLASVKCLTLVQSHGTGRGAVEYCKKYTSQSENAKAQCFDAIVKIQG